MVEDVRRKQKLSLEDELQDKINRLTSELKQERSAKDRIEDEL